MNFSKTFLAGLLAFIVGNVLIAMIWGLFVMGLVGAMSVTATIPDNAILKNKLKVLSTPNEANPMQCTVSLCVSDL